VALAALAQEIRFELVSLLTRAGAEGLPAGEIAARLGVAPASLSFHFQQLVRAGLLTQRRRSRYVLYAANVQVLMALLSYLGDRLGWPPKEAGLAGAEEVRAVQADSPTVPHQ